jgi:hypothetical protein
LVLVALVLVGARATTSAQTPGAVAEATERFEVATIKQNKSGEIGPRFAGRPGRFSAESATLQELIIYAYERQGFEIIDSVNQPSPN